MKKFSINDMSVEKKIGLFAVLILLLLIIVAACGLWSSQSINKERRELYDSYAMGEYYVSEAYSSFCNIMVGVRNAVFYYYGDAAKLEEQETEVAQDEVAVREWLNKFEGVMDIFSPEILAQYQIVEDTLEEWISSTDEDFEMIEAGQHEVAAQDLMTERKVLADKAEAALSTLITMMEEASEKRHDRVEKDLIGMTIILIAVSVVAVILAIVYSGILIKAIVGPVEKLSEVAKQLAAGDVNVDCKKINNDDLGELMDDFQEMADGIKGQAEYAEAIANGDLTIEVEVRSDKDVLGKAFKQLVSDNNRTLGEIKESTQQVTIGAEQVATASQSLAQGSTEQASALEQVTASMAEIAERTKENASQVNEADTLVRSVKGSAEGGNDQMKSLVGAMDDINEASETISKIIKTIDDIAFQTNILALNAAVEAARAGVHGKGFAVVAEEVRSLAAKSAAAASDTSEMIEDTIRKVGNGTRLAEETAKSLDAIVVSIDKVADLIEGIAVASNDQATAVSQIDQAIGQVSTVVQTNSATSEECAAASEELSNQAAHLRELLSSYRLSAGQGGGFSTRMERSSSSMDNEQIISLDGEFGKY